MPDKPDVEMVRCRLRSLARESQALLASFEELLAIDPRIGEHWEGGSMLEEALLRLLGVIATTHRAIRRGIDRAKELIADE